MSTLPPNFQVLKKALNGPRAIYSIKKHPKLYLATNGAGSGAWRIKYRVGKGTAPTRWFTISSDARNADFDQIAAKAKALLNDLYLNGIDPRNSRPTNPVTFQDLFDCWMERHAKVKKKSWHADELMYKRHIKRRIGAEPVSGLDRVRIIAVLDDLADKATPLQANRCQSLISAVFSWALDDGKVQVHPALRIRRRGVEKHREFVMTDEQLRLFWSKLEPLHPKPAMIIKLLLLTGARLSEVAEARTSELRIEGDTVIWTIPGARTKNSNAHVLSLPPEASALFRRAVADAEGNPFVFPARRREPSPFDGNHASRECKRIFAELGIPHMRLHDLRHQVATGMAQCGVPMEIRQWVQNQVTGRRQSIGAIYDQHDYSAEKRRALTLWQDRLLAIIRGEQPCRDRY